MYPLVLAPQMKKVKNNSQKSPNFDAFFNAANAMTMGLALLCAASAGASSASPRRRNPIAEGFSGNIALKAAEGTARQITDFLRSAMSRSWRARIGYLFAKNAFKALRDKLDPSKSNGSVVLGLNGIVVKSHGGTDAEGFAYAVDVGYDMVRNDLLNKINQMLNRDGSTPGSAPTAQEAVS